MMFRVAKGREQLVVNETTRACDASPGSQVFSGVEQHYFLGLCVGASAVLLLASDALNSADYLFFQVFR